MPDFIIPPEKYESIKTRFLSRIRIVDGGCWIWTGSINKHGYGKAHELGRSITAHRLSWILHFGPIPNLHPGPHGTCVCHTCDVPCCVNPKHLWLGCLSDDMRDCVSKGRHGSKRRSAKQIAAWKSNGRNAGLCAAQVRREKTHCIRGHPLSGDNLYIHRGRRNCLACRKEAERRRPKRPYNPKFYLRRKASGYYLTSQPSK